MSAEFFSKHVGAKLATVTVFETHPDAVALDLDAENYEEVARSLTPATAKALGRALIKAGKFVEKKQAAAAKGGAT